MIILSPNRLYVKIAKTDTFLPLFISIKPFVKLYASFLNCF
jgi:hypothetical protein